MRPGQPVGRPEGEQREREAEQDRIGEAAAITQHPGYEEDQDHDGGLEREHSSGYAAAARRESAERTTLSGTNHPYGRRLAV